jgi:hypothetical protein
MKKVNLKKGFLAVAAIALLSANAFGKGKLVISKYLDTEYAVVSVFNDAKSNFKVKVYDAEGSVLYSSPFVKNSVSFQKLFDLSAFTDGEYCVVFESEDAKMAKTFYVEENELYTEENKAMIVMSEAKSSLKPFVRKDGNNIYVSHINFNQSVFSMSIDDKSGNEIYNSSLPSETYYSGKFDISELPAGDYSILLTSGKEKFYYEFNK